MPNNLPLPEELNFLLEKRDEFERRETERREQEVAVENEQRTGPRRQEQRRSTENDS